MSYGRHAHGKGRHRKPGTPPLLSRLIVLAIVATLLVAFAPVMVGLGFFLAIVFGWIGRGLTRI